MNRLNDFANFSVFAKIFDFKVQKSRVRVVNDYTDTSYSRITNIFTKPFLPFHMGPGRVFEKKIISKIS